MANIFKERQDYVKRPNRNNFSLSFTNNLTTKLAQITPIMCKECVPGDVFNIKTALGIRAMPMVFPTLTPVTVEVEFYYVPCRILWDNFKDFIGRTKPNLVHPYLAIPYTRASEIGTGTLADYLGVPTTYAGSNGGQLSVSLTGYRHFSNAQTFTESSTSTIENVPGTQDYNSVLANSQLVQLYDIQTPFLVPAFGPFTPINSASSSLGGIYGYLTDPISYLPDVLYFNNMQGVPDGNYDFWIHPYEVQRDNQGNLVDVGSNQIESYFDWSNTLVVTNGAGKVSLPSNQLAKLQDVLSQYGEIRLFVGQGINQAGLFLDSAFVGNYTTIQPSDIPNLPSLGSPMVLSTQQAIIGDLDPTQNPFVIQSGESMPAIPISSLPFRAYEAIYNVYKRNEIVDPFRINGVTEYNRWVTNLGDGADSTTPLNLLNRNYEYDFLTSCVPSPQQGIAPLVGVTPGGVFTFDDGQGGTMTLTPEVGSDGTTLSGITEYDPNIPQGSLLALEEMIKFGISIDTFRSVNALTTWLQTNIRRGYRYKEQLLSHFGVEIRYDELDMPTFVAGFTRNLSVQEITATAKSGGIELGDYAGQASLFTESRHDMNYHCQEHGFIIATMTICPIPTYSQLLPKLFIKQNPLDYFFPEFNHIGYQPVTYREVAPIQSFINSQDVNDVFGYQRPYYDLVSNVDEQHSRMRSDLTNFLITRVFGSRPQLGRDFIEIDPTKLTSPFVDTSANTDNFICQVYFDISAKRPVSKLAIPRLEP